MLFYRKVVCLEAKTEKHWNSFQTFQLGVFRRSPGVARAGVWVCRKIKLKNFYDPKCAGGCGVVPFSWGPGLCRGDSAALAAHCEARVLLWAWHAARPLGGSDRRTGAPNGRYEKARTRRAGVPWYWLYNLFNFYTFMRSIDNWLCRSIIRYWSGLTINLGLRLVRSYAVVVKIPDILWDT